MSVSNKASSVYQFFQDKEELRTAKLTLLVVIVAFICWSPFVAIILCPLLQSNNIKPILEKPTIQAVSKAIAAPKNEEDTFVSDSDSQNHPTSAMHPLFFTDNDISLLRGDEEDSFILINLPHIPKYTQTWISNSTSSYLAQIENDDSQSIIWLHFASCMLMISFTAISPYIYVFRSEKVRKCLNELFRDHFYCSRYCDAETDEPRRSPSLASKISNHQNVSQSYGNGVISKLSIGSRHHNSVLLQEHVLANGTNHGKIAATMWQNETNENVDVDVDYLNIASSCKSTFDGRQATRRDKTISIQNKDRSQMQKILSCPNISEIPEKFLESSL